MRRPVLTGTLALALASAVGTLVLGQQKPTYRSGAEVVPIDVNVVDRSHNPVSDLKREDFTVSVDSRARKVISAQFIRYDTRPGVTQRVVAPGEAEAVTRAPIAAPARSLLIVVDDDSMEPGDQVRELVEEPVQALPHDGVA